MAEDQTKQEEINRERWLQEELQLEERIHQAINPGGEKAVARLAQQGKRPVRELIQALIDPDTEFFELGVVAGFGLDYPGGIKDVPCAGLVTGLGKIHGNWSMIFANDSRVKAGTYFPITLKKHMRAQAIAEQCGLNCVYIADSGGAFLPMQADVFPDDGHFGSMFYNMARMSAMGLKQITLSTGGNTAGGAYIVFMADEALMIEGLAYSFLGGPPLVKAAIGEDIDAEALGGALVHTRISGGADHLCKDQLEGVHKVREILSQEVQQRIHLQRFEELPPAASEEMIYDLMPAGIHQAVDIRRIIECFSDGVGLQEYKRNYAPGRGDNLVTGKIRIKGIPVGVVAANNSGIIFVESARKATEFIIRCAMERTPLLFIQNSPGYMVGSDAEHRGIGKYGADMVRAVSNARVPRIQLVVGPDNGAANYGMCGRAYKPHFLFSTMRARTSVMSGRSAAEVLLSIERRKRKLKHEEMTDAEAAAFKKELLDKYESEAHPFYCGARLFNDRVLFFKEIRKALALALEVSLLAPISDSTFGNFRF
ncbi:MAG: propionyl-CoA carboxylase [Deltaproteobacteria bacterium]|nr:MAG: propionyl-CoA carboxylase [Deltaproteobacteria bacterium]